MVVANLAGICGRDDGEVLRALLRVCAHCRSGGGYSFHVRNLAACLVSLKDELEVLLLSP